MAFICGNRLASALRKGYGALRITSVQPVRYPARILSIAPIVRSLCSAIPTATVGCCRRSQHASLVASTLPRLRLAPQAIWRVHFGGSGPRRAREAHRRTARRELARLVRLVYGGGAVWRRASPMKAKGNHEVPLSAAPRAMNNCGNGSWGSATLHFRLYAAGWVDLVTY